MYVFCVLLFRFPTLRLYFFNSQKTKKLKGTDDFSGILFNRQKISHRREKFFASIVSIKHHSRTHIA